MDIEDHELTLQKDVAHDSISIAVIALNASITMLTWVTNLCIYTVRTRHGMLGTVDVEAQISQLAGG